MAKAIGYKIESCKADHMLFNGDFYTATNSSEQKAHVHKGLISAKIPTALIGKLLMLIDNGMPPAYIKHQLQIT